VAQITDVDWPVNQDGVVTLIRLLSLPAHAALELAAGLVLLTAPFVLGFGAAGLVASVAAGALVVGLALSAATTEGAAIPVGAHFAFDRGMALGLLGGAVALAATGNRAPAVLFGLAALVQLALNVTTRYSARA
jgi:hypothetical protein